MRLKIEALTKRIGLESYWYFIVLGLVVVTILFLTHLSSGWMPDSTAFTIPVLQLPVFWYGIFIVGGIFLGAVVTSKLAEIRARQVFATAVPPTIYGQSLKQLKLSAEIEQKLSQHKITELDQLLFVWGMDPRNTGLKTEQIELVGKQLEAMPEIDDSWLTAAPWKQWNPDHVWSGLIICLIFGVIGARLYHVLTPSPSMAAFGIETPWDYFQNPAQLINIRAGGLGIYGGLAGGAVGLFIYTRYQHISMLGWADLAVVGVALGQVFGRWGNFFNQELYGRPTNLPWAITIEEVHRLPAYRQFSTFHPAFLYESLWSLLAFFVLYFLAKRVDDKLLRGELTALYLIFYAIGRILLETVRLDSRTLDLAGLNLNMAVATFVSILVALAMALWVGLRRWRLSRP